MMHGWKHDVDPSIRDVVSYNQALDAAAHVSRHLQMLEGEISKKSSGFVANLCTPGYEYVASMWGIWGAGKASVPLALTQKVPEIEHVLSDTQPDAILLGGNSSLLNNGVSQPYHVPPNEACLVQAAENLGLSDRIVRLQDLQLGAPLPGQRYLGNGVDLDAPALILYTSGTTGKPKGVVSTHRNVYHQVTDLVSSWEWHKDDVAIHVLPLHHVHGVINILSCAAYTGAQVDFARFDAEELWEQWATPPSDLVPTVFMAVPTIYAKLLEAAGDTVPDDVVQSAVETTLQPMRLMVSGSAALPVSVLERWRNLTSHTLLERYGMTEFAMALSNPYQPVDERQAGHVGLPLPSVEVKIVDEESGQVVDTPNTGGHLFVRGTNVFKEYLNRPDATEEAFDDDGFFDTGDVAEFNSELNSYRILGRGSVDILKVGGYKISALDIERVLLEHPDIAEVAIMGVADETWGERVGMLCRLKALSSGTTLSLDELKTWCEDKMSKYKIPSRLLLVDEIPKNAMGKVNKKDLVKLFDKEKSSS
jgi:malonyl-CoA/methylmalonyl-CoA synthetase